MSEYFYSLEMIKEGNKTNVELLKLVRTRSLHCRDTGELTIYDVDLVGDESLMCLKYILKLLSKGVAECSYKGTCRIRIRFIHQTYYL